MLLFWRQNMSSKSCCWKLDADFQPIHCQSSTFFFSLILFAKDDGKCSYTKKQKARALKMLPSTRVSAVRGQRRTASRGSVSCLRALWSEIHFNSSTLQCTWQEIGNILQFPLVQFIFAHFPPRFSSSRQHGKNLNNSLFISRFCNFRRWKINAEV